MDLADQETLRYRVINKPSGMPNMFARLMNDWDSIDNDQFEDRIEDLIDEIEGQEIRLTKQKVIFNVTEQDRNYYQKLIDDVNAEITKAKELICSLEQQLCHQKKLKQYKAKFEELSITVNKFTPAQDSIEKIEACQSEHEKLDRACQNEAIHQKQMQLHKLVSMIQDFRAEVSAEPTDFNLLEASNKDDEGKEVKGDIEMLNKEKEIMD